MVFELVIITKLLLFPNVAGLERRLGHHSFQVREQATRDLRLYGNLPLCRRLMTHHDPEVRLRASQVYFLTRDRVVASLAPYPCLDALWYDTATRSHNIQSVVARRCWHYISYDGSDSGIYADPAAYRQATEWWLRDQVDQGTPVWVLRLILWEMWRRDKVAGYSGYGS